MDGVINILGIIVSAIIVDNFVFSRVMGICPFMGRGVSVYSLVESRETLGCKVSRKSMAF